MRSPTEFTVIVAPGGDKNHIARQFTSDSLTHMVSTVEWMIAMLPTEMDRATARVSLMMLLRHPAEGEQ